ncbi:EamA family transporter [Nanoarchaeota archaeon]
MNYLGSIVLAIISSMLAALGQLSLKLGSRDLKRRLSHLIKNYFLLIGLLFYGLSSIVFIIALRGHELTVLYPIAALNYVWVSLLAIKYLKERMNKYKWGGIALILIGVSLIV